jgi:hypothetical protein
MLNSLEKILQKTGGAWTEVCNEYARWDQSPPGYDRKRTDGLVDSPVGWGERPLMGLLLQAFKRAHPDLPCMSETSTERRNKKKKPGGSRTPDLWLGINDPENSNSVYVDGKVAFAYWNGSAFAWHRRGKHLHDPSWMHKLALKQLKNIKAAARLVVALFVVFEIPMDTSEMQEKWPTRFEDFLETIDPALEAAGTVLKSDFDTSASTTWNDLRESATGWKDLLKLKNETKFYPRARLFLYEVQSPRRTRGLRHSRT